MARPPASVSRKQSAPVRLGILPIRDQVLFPGIVSTLHVARETSRNAVQAAHAGDGMVVAITQRDSTQSDLDLNDLHSVGTRCEILHIIPLPDGSLRVALRGIETVTIAAIDTETAIPTASTEARAMTGELTERDEATRRLIIEGFSALASGHSKVPPESLESVIHAPTPGDSLYAVAHFLPVPVGDKQSILETQSRSQLQSILLAHVERERRLLVLEQEIKDSVESEVARSQREYFLKQQLRVITEALDPSGGHASEVQELDHRIRAAQLTPDVERMALSELRRYRYLGDASGEAQACRSYIETLLQLPGPARAAAPLPLPEAAALLDRHHYGMEAIKERMLEFLAVRQLRGDEGGAVLLFLGPPGVGKTSLARSVAQVLNRPFASLALGGVADEPEIRGHRRTYVGSRPGRVVSALQQCQSLAPVLLLDEIDKLGRNGASDPASALLELLDPEQNMAFIDHYLEVPLDLSKVVFIATANLIDAIPAALLDRVEVVEFTSYTPQERVQILKQHIWPRAVEESGLSNLGLKLSDGAAQRLASDYTAEVGVRGLNRETQKLLRRLAKRVAEGKTIGSEIGSDDLQALLDPPAVPRMQLPKSAEIGVTLSLVVTGLGGDIMPIEVALNRPLGAEPKLVLTGAVGDVMQESARTALTCVRRMLDQQGLDSRFDIHIHLPQAAIKKDGPSAGITIATALYSALTGKSIQPGITMTGEISLRGHVLSVGGLREKFLAARRYQAKTCVYPAEQTAEVEAMGADVKAGLNLIPVSTLDEVLRVCLAHAQTVSIL